MTIGLMIMGAVVVVVAIAAILIGICGILVQWQRNTD